MSGATVRRAALGLGANLGDRLAALQSAIDLIAADADVVPVAVSSVYETDPVGGPEQPDFLNAVLVVDYAGDPAGLLELAQRAEAAADRVRVQRWGPRTLDVDVLAIGDVELTSPDLVVPHPRAGERAFVLVPWAQADPDAAPPGIGPVPARRDAVGTAGVRRRDDLALRLSPAPTRADVVEVPAGTAAEDPA